jgi:hypothetical protein
VSQTVGLTRQPSYPANHHHQHLWGLQEPSALLPTCLHQLQRWQRSQQHRRLQQQSRQQLWGVH